MRGSEMGDLTMSGMMAWMLVAGLLTSVTLAAVVVGTVWAVMRRWSAPGRDSADPAPVQIRRRFGAGETDEHDDRSRRAVLHD